MLSDTKQDQQRSLDAPAAGSLTARASREQTRLWFLATKNPEETTYNMAYRLDFRGRFEPDRIERVIAVLQDRHETLRTRFAFDGEDLLQVIEDSAPAKLERVDAPGTAYRERLDAADQLAEEFAAETIPLDRAPLFQCRLIRIEEDHFALIFAMHHIVGDGWSHAVLTRDFCEAYALLETADDVSLPPLSLQFADFAEFQNAPVSEGIVSQQVDFWVRQLAGLPALDLPIAPPTRLRQRAGHHRWRAEAADTRRLRESIKARKMFLSSLLLTAFERALGLMSGQDDYFLGTVIANRNNPDVAEMIGFFANTVILPARGVLTRPTSSQLADNQSLMVELQANQEAPLNEVIDGLNLTRKRHEDAPIQALFVLQNAPYEEISISGVTIELERLRIGEAKVPVTLFVTEGSEAIDFEIEYDPARVEEALVSDLMDLFREELSALAQTSIPERANERRIVSGPVVPESLGRTVVDLIWAKADEQPEPVALSYLQEQLTYRELTARADTLAAALATRGIAPQSRIATCLPRGIELYVSLVGIMRAGMVWSPIDPDAPLAYREAVLKALDPALVIGSRDEGDFCSFASLFEDIGAAEPPSLPSPDQTAYAISTSGTSGTPKTVLVGHEGLANICLWISNTLALQPSDIGLWKTTMVFDAVCRELFPTLIAGGRLAIAPPDSERDMEVLRDHIDQHAVSTFHCVPTQLRALMEDGPLPSSLRAIMCGGEPLPTDLAHRAITENSLALYNVYGPTEATVDVTSHQVTGSETRTNIPIGFPVDNVRLALTYEHRLLPPTARGEITVGGCAVAQGYLAGNDGGFGAIEGLGAAYRTGDLGTFDRGGELHCEGRLDRQVKVNGVRIEPGAVEAALRQMPGVGDAQTAVIEGDRSEFVAFLFAGGEAEPGAVQAEADGGEGEWQPVFEDSYIDLDWDIKPEDNTQGWVDSGTRELIPPQEVLAATDDASAKILRWKPTRILELGCGIGTLAFRLIPHVDEFFGIDFSQSAIDYCRHHATLAGFDRARFEVGNIEAFDFSDEEKFDAVVLNSVVQYLADEDALDALLKRLEPLLAEGGYLFLGDLRDQRQSDVHAFWKMRRRRGADTPCEDILLAALTDQLADGELLLEPDWLATWAQDRGFAPPLIEYNCAEGDNELVNFRFSATLCRPNKAKLDELTFHQAIIPNSAVAREAALLDHAVRARPNQPISRTLPQWLDTGEPGALPDYASLLEAKAFVLATNDPRELKLTQLAEPATLAIFAEQFGHRPKCDQIGLPTLPNPSQIDRQKWRRFVRAVGEVPRRLRGLIPQQMMPQRHLPLPYCPRLPNGKKNLAVLERWHLAGRASAQAEYPEPGTLEDRIANIFQSLLGSPFALDDDFFALGGNSLQATRARNRLERELSITLPLRSLFESGTPRALAREIETSKQDAQSGPRKRKDGTAPVISHAQRRLWFIEKLGTSGAVYNIAHAVSLAGEIDLGALDRAVGQLCKRHVTLRSTFSELDGEPQLRISPPRSVGNIELIDHCVSQEDAIAFLDLEQRKRFDLENGPLLRVLAIRISSAETILCLICHHIVSDGWSMGIALAELAALYEAERTSTEPALPELGVDYLDLALHDEHPEQQKRFKAQIEYWQNELAGASPKLDLPFDRARTKRRSWQGDTLEFDLGKKISSRIEEFARQERSTPFIVLLSVFHLVLRTLAQKNDTVIGTVLANRNRYESEGLVGFLVNPLPLRLKSVEGDSFRSLCARTREVSLRGFDNQDVPFDIMVEHLPIERAADSQAIFQVLFALQNNTRAKLQLGGLEATRLRLPPIGAMFDLSLELRPRMDGFQAALEFSTELFDRATADRIAKLFEHMLQACLEAPDTSLEALTVLPESQHEQLLQFGRGEQIETEPDGTICSLVAEIARNSPERDCLIDGEDRVSFGQLVAEARELAERLVAAACKDDDAVAIEVSRGPAVVVAMLAAQWAGTAPCYIDPVYPEDRRKQLYRLAGCKFSIRGNDQSLSVFDSNDAPLTENAAVEQPKCKPGHLAFLAFTSGTTGEPKVVRVSHRAVCARLTANDIALGELSEHDNFAHCYSFNYDGGLVCAFWPLTRGTPITFLPLALLGEGKALADFCQAAALTVIDAIPLAIATLVQEPLDLPRLRLVTTGGDTCPVDLHRRVRDVLPHAGFANQYGPCEGVFNATTAYYPPGSPPAENVTIGVPIAGCDIAIVDPTGNLVPIGVYGEIWIGDPYLADGYLNNPEADATKFADAEFFGHPQRFLRSGDRGRWLANGEIEFAGRLDRQIQLNGMRVEPDEIEAALRKLPEVEEASVLVASEAERPILSAFIVPSDKRGDAAPMTHEWESAFDTLYHPTQTDSDALLDFSGWTRTSDGDRIPEAEMRLWLSDTVDLLKAQNPQRVLEVGCGLGLIALSLAPSTQEYLATDISANAIASLREKAGAHGIALRAERVSADDVASTYHDETFELIVINSVVQYLSGFEELSDLIGSLSARLSPGGAIFVGDVRDLRRSEAFYASVERSRHPGRSSEEVAERVRQARLQDDEAHFDPAAFCLLSEQIGMAEPIVRIKPLTIDNEMVNFRYDVLIESKSAQRAGGSAEELAWKEIDLQRVASLLSEKQDPFVIDGLPFASLDRSDEKSSELQSLLHEARSHNWHCALFPSHLGPDLCRLTLAKSASEPVLWQSFSNETARLERLSNHPGFSTRARALRPKIRASLEASLPAHMVPAVLVFLDELPTKPGGKIDEARLRKLVFAEQSSSTEFVGDDILLAAMTDVWRNVLDIDALPPDADFFAFGGHSLLATKLVAKIQQEFGVTVPVVRVFELRTLRRLTASLFSAKLPSAGSDAETAHLDSQSLARLAANHLQLRAWNARFPCRVEHFGTAFVLTSPVTPAAILPAIDALVMQHPVLLWRFDEDGDIADCDPDRELLQTHDLGPSDNAKSLLQTPMQESDGIFAIDAFLHEGAVREIAVRARSDFFDGASLQQVFSAMLAGVDRDRTAQAKPVRYPGKQEWQAAVEAARAAMNDRADPASPCFSNADPKTTTISLNREETSALEAKARSWGVTTPALLMGVLASTLENQNAAHLIDCAIDGRIRQQSSDFFPIGPQSEELRFRFVDDDLPDLQAFAECAADQLIGALQNGPTDIADRSLQPAPVAFSYRFGSTTDLRMFSDLAQGSAMVAPAWHETKLSCLRGADGLDLVLNSRSKRVALIEFEAAVRELCG